MAHLSQRWALGFSYVAAKVCPLEWFLGYKVIAPFFYYLFHKEFLIKRFILEEERDVLWVMCCQLGHHYYLIALVMLGNAVLMTWEDSWKAMGTCKQEARGQKEIFH